MKRVLVTGAGGFVGRHCLPELVELGYDVHALRWPNREPRSCDEGLPRDVAAHQADLFDFAAVGRLVCDIRPTHLLHLAWITTPGEYWTSPRNLDWVAASLTLFRAFADAGGRRIVASGTCAEYDWGAGICTEDVTPIRPASLYGRAKHAVHELLDGFAEQAGLSAAWARLFFLYGPYASGRRLPGAVIEPLLRGEPAPCSTGDVLRDFLYVADAARAIVRILDSDQTGAVNVASGKPVPLKTMIRTCGRLIGREELLAWGAHHGGDDAPLVVGDIRRLSEELAWSPAVSLEEGLQQTIDWWRNQMGGNRAAA
jgi:nucleoside-diphosphate-sugar epimerase